MVQQEGYVELEHCHICSKAMEFPNVFRKLPDGRRRCGTCNLKIRAEKGGFFAKKSLRDYREWQIKRQMRQMHTTV